VLFNLRGILKSKDKLMYRWCCYKTLNLYQERRLAERLVVVKEILKDSDGGITLSCKVFLDPKGLEALK